MSWNYGFSVGFRGDSVSISIPSEYIIVGTIWIVLGLFGYFYHAYVSRKMGEGFDDDVWVFVVIGVAVTLLGAALRDPDGALWVLTCFAFSGSYMVYGSIDGHVKAKRIRQLKAQRAIIAALAEAKTDATPQR